MKRAFFFTRIVEGSIFQCLPKTRMSEELRVNSLHGTVTDHQDF